MLKQEKNKIIEFFGLSGSGKTTSASYLCKKYPERFFLVQVSKIEGIFLSILFIIRYPFFTNFFLKENKKNKGDIKSLVRHLFFVSSSAFLKARFVSFFTNKKIIIDEGFLTRFLSLYSDKITDEKASLYLSKMPKFNKTIFVFKGESFERYRNKEKYIENPRAAFGEEILNNWIENQKTNFEVLLKTLKSRDFSVIDVDAFKEGDLEKNIL